MHRRSATLALAGLIVLFSGGGASAARLEVVASSATIAPGDPLSVSVLGDSEGVTDTQANALLVYTGNTTPSNATGPFELETTNPDTEWLRVGVMGRCDLGELPPNSCLVLDAFVSPSIPSDLLFGTFTLFDFDTSAAIPGTLLTFQAVPHERGFFGAGPSEVVTVEVIPEPAPALLVSLGLLVLAKGWGYRRARAMA